MSDIPVLNMALCLNTSGFCAAETMKTLLINVINFLAHKQEKTLVNYFFVESKSSNPSRAANMLCKRLTEIPYDYAFMFDLDMVFPPNLLSTLVLDAEEKKLDIVCGWAFQKHFPPVTNLLIKQPDGKYATVTEVGVTDLFEVDATGKSCMLLRKGVIESIDPPWFQDTQADYSDGENFTGPDIYFCEKIKSKGYKIWVDPNMRCGHVGEYVY